MSVTFRPSGAGTGTAAWTQQAGADQQTTERIDWNGFSLGKIPTDREALRIELRRSYAGVDQEMLRQMAERDQKVREGKRQEDANKQQRPDDGKVRREFTLVETPLAAAPAADSGSSASAGGARGAGGKGGKGSNPEDMFEQAIELSNGFNEAGATFKV